MNEKITGGEQKTQNAQNNDWEDMGHDASEHVSEYIRMQRLKEVLEKLLLCEEDGLTLDVAGNHINEHGDWRSCRIVCKFCKMAEGESPAEAAQRICEEMRETITKVIAPSDWEIFVNLYRGNAYSNGKHDWEVNKNIIGCVVLR